MAYNNNFSNFNGNPCYTPASFSGITNSGHYNFKQPSVSDWSYANQYMPLSQYYEHCWKNHHYSSQSQWGYNSPKSYYQPPYQHPASYTPSPEQPLEESIDWEKRMEALDELERWIQILKDSKFLQNFQITDPYSIFQGEHDNLEKSMETMTCQNDPLDMIEARVSRLENMRRNKETLPTQSLNILDTSSHIEKTKNNGILKTLIKIQFHHKTLNLTNINPLIIWQVFILMRLNLIMNMNPIPNFVIQFLFSNLYWLRYSYPI